VVEKSPQQVKCQPKLFYGSDGYTSGGHSLWYSVLLGLSSLVLMKLATLLVMWVDLLIVTILENRTRFLRLGRLKVFKDISPSFHISR
jgi:hypothetical protein